MSELDRGLFRKQALEFHRLGGVRGDVLHITPAMLGAMQALLFAIAVVGLTFVCTAEVRRYSNGPAVVLLDGRHDVTADRPGVIGSIDARVGQRVHAGDVLVHLSAQSETVELAAIERELEDQLLLLMRQPDDHAARDALIALRARRDVAETALERSVLHASDDAEVVDLRVRVGQRVEPGTPLLALQGAARNVQLTALLPGPDRPRIRAGMPLRVRLSGFERASLELQVESVDEQVLGPREAMRAIGPELADAFEVSGPIVLVHARLPLDGLKVRGVQYRLHHGMPGQAEIAVEREPVLFAWLPGLREALGDVY
jgi:multidrug resistance efflux pump